MEKFDELVHDLLELCDEKNKEISREPLSDTERGYKIATILLCNKVKSIIRKNQGQVSDSFTIDEFNKILDQIENKE